MFNVCPGCGEYSDEKRIVTACDGEASTTAGNRLAFAVCLKCHHHHPFKSLPLLVITGASGSGKTAAGLKLANLVQDCVCLESDILWNDAFNNPEEDYKTYRNLWLRVAKNINQNDRPVVLIGSSTPGQFEKCNESRYFSKIHYLALVCEENELIRRLTARPSWRKSSSNDVLQNMTRFNKWLLENAAVSVPPMSIVDTSHITVDETVRACEAWINTVLTNS